MEKLRNLQSRLKKINLPTINQRAIRGLLGLKRLDTYIISKFIGTYFFSILLIISISIVFDFNENLSKFTQYHAPWQAIVFDYYANFCAVFRKPLLTALLLHCRNLLYVKTGRQLGNNRHHCSRSELQATDAPLHDFMCADKHHVILSRFLCHTERKCRAAEFRVHVQEQQEEHLRRQCAVAGGQRCHRVHKALRQHPQDRIRLLP